jgi:glycosyltransferase involved in cell wall biosynthesis
VYHQAAALAEAGEEVLIIAGEAPQSVPAEVQGIPLALVEGLGYDRAQSPGNVREPGTVAEDARKLADALEAAVETHWPLGADILHVHNPLIQKNAALLPALNILNRRGVKLLLQNHDLAEDFRPDVYTVAGDYPENCHYAVINSRDYAYLHRAGLSLEGLHLIPNEVAPVTAAAGLERRRYLYPVRAIRRKNIGEALLISLFIPKGRTVAITLPPTTETDRAVYRHWQALAEELSLPVEFEAGLDHSLADVFGSALGILSTSVKEGFGFSFLEPWTAGRAVIGRRIEYVCRDFEEAGVQFNSPLNTAEALYRTIDIPGDYIAIPVLKAKMESALSAVYRAFGKELPGFIIQLLDDKLFSGKIDFAILDEELQTEIIRILASNSTVFREVAAMNPFLAELGDWRSDEDLIGNNAQVISRAYGREPIAAVLRDTYQKVVHTDVTHRLSKVLLLDLYLDPLKFFLIGVSHV